MKRLIGILLTLSLVSSAICKAELNAPKPEGAEDSKFPYVAQVVGSQVYIRANAGLNYYRCAKISEPAQVVVVEEVNGWSKIVPPKGSFSWISKKYVEKDSVNPGFGIVTDDNVRVWIGSQYNPPIHCVEMQLKLNTGDTVKFYGEEEDGYYRIEPPKGGYLFINSAYLKELGPLSKFKPKPGTKETKPAQAKKADKPADNKAAATADKTKDSAEKTAVDAKTEKAEEKKPEPVKIVQTPEEIKGLQTYTKLTDLIDAELKKPLKTQNYAKIKSGLASLAQNEKAGKASRYAKFQLERIQAYEAAKNAQSTVQKQDQELAKIRAQIKSNLENKLNNIPDAPKYKVAGTLYPSAIFTGETGKARYIIKDASGKIIAYATPAQMLSKSIMRKYFGKKVGLQGNVKADPNSSIALIEFTQVDLLSK